MTEYIEREVLINQLKDLPTYWAEALIMPNEEKVCPLSMSGDYNYPLTPCQCEKCAWWDEEAQACAVLVAAKAIKKRK